MRQVNLELLKQLREKAGLTQDNVAKRLGYKTSLGYHYIETGRCRLKADQAFVLADLFKVSVDDLFFDKQVTTTVTKKLPQTGTDGR